MTDLFDRAQKNEQETRDRDLANQLARRVTKTSDQDAAGNRFCLSCGEQIASERLRQRQTPCAASPVKLERARGGIAMEFDWIAKWWGVITTVVALLATGVMLWLSKTFARREELKRSEHCHGRAGPPALPASKVASTTCRPRSSSMSWAFQLRRITGTSRRSPPSSSPPITRSTCCSNSV